MRHAGTRLNPLALLADSSRDCRTRHRHPAHAPAGGGLLRLQAEEAEPAAHRISSRQNTDAYRQRLFWRTLNRGISQQHRPVRRASAAVRDFAAATRGFLGGEGVRRAQRDQLAGSPSRAPPRWPGGFGRRADAFVVGIVGRCRPQKGHPYLLEAAARLAPEIPELRLLVVGQGHLRGGCGDPRTLGIADRVSFVGFHEDMATAYAAMDVFCMPSLFEGLPLALLEALICGKVAVAARAPGITDVLVDGENGLLVDVADPSAWRRRCCASAAASPIPTCPGGRARRPSPNTTSSATLRAWRPSTSTCSPPRPRPPLRRRYPLGSGPTSMEETTQRPAPATDRSSDARHVARSGVLQLLSAVGQGLMPVTHILVARLFGTAVFGAYQASVAILDVLTRAGQAGSMGGMHRFIAAHRAAGEADLERSALGTGIRLTVGGFGGPRDRPGVAGEADRARVARAQPRDDAADPGPRRVAGGDHAGAHQRDAGREGGAHEPLRAGSRRAAAVAVGGRDRLAARPVAAQPVRRARDVGLRRHGPGGGGLSRACSARRSCGRRWAPRATAASSASRYRWARPISRSAVMQRADTLLVASFAGLDALAVYTAAEFITRLIANPRYLFDYIIAPVLAEALQVKDHARVRYNLALVTRWVVTACVPVAVTIIALRAEILEPLWRHVRDGRGHARDPRVPQPRDRMSGPDALCGRHGRALAARPDQQHLRGGAEHRARAGAGPTHGHLGRRDRRGDQHARVSSRVDDRGLGPRARASVHDEPPSRWARRWWPLRSSTPCTRP